MKHAYVAQDSLRGLPPVTPFASEDKPAVVDNSYTAVEKARDAAIRNGAPLDATSVDRKYQEIQSRGAHGRLP